MVTILEEFVPIHEVQEISNQIIEKLASFSSDERMIVGIAGRPGSGKTCLSRVIANAILHRSSNDIQVVAMPMDGYHLYREELSRMPNPEYAFARRGAHWTFNPEKLYLDLVNIRDGIRNGNDIKVPSFDHALKDPKENDIIVAKDVRLVLVEGNYLFHTKHPTWSKVNDMFDLKVFLDCDPIECTERLVLRHMASWGISREAAMVHAKGSDFKNGELIDTTKHNADVVCHSINIIGNSAKNVQSM